MEKLGVYKNYKKKINGIFPILYTFFNKTNILFRKISIRQLPLKYITRSSSSEDDPPSSSEDDSPSFEDASLHPVNI